MPNGFGGSIREELAFCKLPSKGTESDCTVLLSARPRPRGAVTHQHRYSHSITRNTHTRSRTEGCEPQGKRSLHSIVSWQQHPETILPGDISPS